MGHEKMSTLHCRCSRACAHGSYSFPCLMWRTYCVHRGTGSLSGRPLPPSATLAYLYLPGQTHLLPAYRQAAPYLCGTPPQTGLHPIAGVPNAFQGSEPPEGLSCLPPIFRYHGPVRASGKPFGGGWGGCSWRVQLPPHSTVRYWCFPVLSRDTCGVFVTQVTVSIARVSDHGRVVTTSAILTITGCLRVCPVCKEVI